MSRVGGVRAIRDASISPEDGTTCVRNLTMHKDLYKLLALPWDTDPNRPLLSRNQDLSTVSLLLSEIGHSGDVRGSQRGRVILGKFLDQTERDAGVRSFHSPRAAGRREGSRFPGWQGRKLDPEPASVHCC